VSQGRCYIVLHDSIIQNPSCGDHHLRPFPLFAMNWPLLALLLGAGASLACLVGAMNTALERRIIDNVPTSKTSGVFIGFVKVKGRAESDTPLTSFLSDVECVFYNWSVSEHWKRTVTESYTDSNGKPATRTREEEGWKCVAGGGARIPFVLRDDCGEILIQPEGGIIQPLPVFFQSCGQNDPLYFGKGPSESIEDSDHRRQFEETAIPLHVPLCILGQAREREDIVAAEIAADAAAPMFLISTRTEEQISKGYGWTSWGCGFLGMVLLISGLVIHDLILGMAISDCWPEYFSPAYLYLLASVVGWVWMDYNSLIDLLQRVRQAESLVDVQLQRRHDLIPGLAEIVRGIRDHENWLLPRLAALRSELLACPASIGEGSMEVFLALQEAYPELKSHDAFMALQRSLSETEDRIALARGYLNEITTNYNNRLQTVPECFVARLAGMQYRPLVFDVSVGRLFGNGQRGVKS